MLTCDAPDIPEENKVFSKIKDDLPKMYISQLRSMSIENKYLKQWITLINMRYQEYTDDKVKAREAAMIVESQDKDIDIKNFQKSTNVTTPNSGNWLSPSYL